MNTDSDYYKINKDRALIYSSTYILYLMEKHNLPLSASKFHHDRELADVASLLLDENLIITNEENYELTEAGRNKSISFQERHSYILTYIDIFAFVDLQEGTFAFEKFGTFSDPKEWTDYCNDERWSDLRVAMIDYLDGDATELVFSQMTLDDLFTTEESSWRQDLMRGKWWRQIQDICDSAIQEEDLGYTNENGEISGEHKEIHTNLALWYDEIEPPAYGSAQAIDKTSRPPWETPWTL